MVGIGRQASAHGCSPKAAPPSPLYSATEGGLMTDQDPMRDALTEAGTSLLRTLGIILLIIVAPIVLMGAVGILFFALGGTVDH